MWFAQISDMHVTRAGEGTDYSGDTGRGLERCVEAIVRSGPPPDLVVASGDLVNLGTPEEYARLRALLAPMPVPVYLLPGNHDRRDELRRAFADHAYLPPHGALHYVVERKPLRFVVLDTVIEGEDGGTLDDRQLDWLAATLESRADVPTVIVMHHPPLATGMTRMDGIALDAASASRLGDIVGRHAHIQRIACGHVHRAAHAQWHNTIVSICPSTAFQARVDLTVPGEFAATKEPPAYHMHYWNGESLVTHTVFLETEEKGIE